MLYWFECSKESQAIKELLDCYRDTPHPATGVPPNAMLFKNQPESSFPTKQLSDTDIEMARLRDKTLKEDRTCDINNRKYKHFTKIEEGDHVLLRNNKRTSKGTKKLIGARRVSEATSAENAAL